MFYATPVKDDDGCYIVNVKTDDKKKCLVQLNKVSTVFKDGEIVINLGTSKNLKKIAAIDEENIQAAAVHSVEWFSKEMSTNTLSSSYTSSVFDGDITASVIGATKVFNGSNELVDISMLVDISPCNVLLEFAGIWFARKAFGPTWNVVQVKMIKTTEPEPVDEYPQEYALKDEESEEE